MQTFENQQNELYNSTNHPAICGFDILNSYLSSRTNGFRFLTVNNALNSETNGTVLPTSSPQEESKVDTGLKSGEFGQTNGKKNEATYPAPPQIKRMEMPRLLFNIHSKKQRAQKRKFGNTTLNSEKYKNEFVRTISEERGKTTNSSYTVMRKTTINEPSIIFINKNLRVV